MTTEATSRKSEEAVAPGTCWSCGKAPGAGHFCAACGKIQPLERDADYFALLGLPRKLTVKLDDLEQRFHRLSWKLHPDNFVRASEYERELSLVRASQLNDAYRALRDPVTRVEYLLASAGKRREGQNKQQAPPELLEEVFELNESLDELRGVRQGGGDPAERAQLAWRLEEAGKGFEEKLGVVDAELELIGMEWDRLSAENGGAIGAETAEQVKLMNRMNDVLNRRSYIRNLVQSVRKELAEA